MPREIRIQDTLTGGVRKLEPRDPGKVAIYACGPTVYGPIHVGNARPYVVFSLLKRFLHRAPCGCETHCQSLIQLGAKTAERVLQVLPCRPAQVLCVADHDGVDLFE